MVVDWGLAKRAGEEPALEATALMPPSEPGLTVAGVALGTPAYMSPEQARGALGDISERSDVFSLGAILYELLTARMPFEGASAEHVIEKARQGRFARVRDVCPDAPAELAAVAERALSLDPQHRYARADLLANELLAYRRGERVKAYEYRSWELLTKFVGKNRALTLVSGLAVIVLLAAAVVIQRQLHVARAQLAASLLERARAAEQSADWARAAGYYAASRVQQDSREGRWGYALAHQRLAPRVIERHGGARSFIATGYLPDGRAVVIASEPQWTVARELDSGRELWRSAQPDPLVDVVVDSERVLLASARALQYLDLATGRRIGTFDRRERRPCPWGPVPARALLVANASGLYDLVVEDGGQPPRALARNLSLTGYCAISPQGDRAAVQDTQGVVHVWDLTTLTEIASRPAHDAAQLMFTAHGIAIVRSQSIELFAGSAGDFLVPIPARGGNGLMAASATGAISRDGHVIALPRLMSNQADVVDLRTRTVVASLSFAAGNPRLALAPAGDRLLVAGLLDSSLLLGWDIKPAVSAASTAGSARMAHLFARDGQRFLVLHIAETIRLEVRADTGALLRTFELPTARGNAALSEDGNRLVTFASDTISIRDVGSGALLTQFDCHGCLRIHPSGDGTRLITNNGKEIVLWDVVRKEAIWRETTRVGRLRDPLTVSNDGRRVLWGRDAMLYIHTVGGTDEELRVDNTFEDAQLSHDATQLAVVTRQTIGVWQVAGLHPVFRIPNPTAVAQEVAWSRDDSALINGRDSVGASLIDARSGQPFATVRMPRPAALGADVRVSPDLRYFIARGDATWDIHPLPLPDEAPPEDSLARVREQTGLALHGVDFEYAPREQD